MKLNPEDLEIVSFDTADVAGLQAHTFLDGPVVDPNDPTPDSRCFVCD